MPMHFNEPDNKTDVLAKGDADDICLQLAELIGWKVRIVLIYWIIWIRRDDFLREVYLITQLVNILQNFKEIYRSSNNCIVMKLIIK